MKPTTVGTCKNKNSVPNEKRKPPKRRTAETNGVVGISTASMLGTYRAIPRLTRNDWASYVQLPETFSHGTRQVVSLQISVVEREKITSANDTCFAFGHQVGTFPLSNRCALCFLVFGTSSQHTQAHRYARFVVSEKLSANPFQRARTGVRFSAAASRHRFRKYLTYGGTTGRVSNSKQALCRV